MRHRPDAQTSWHEKASYVASVLRRRVAAQGPLEFGRVYLKSHFTLPPSPMHEEASRLLRRASVTRGRRIAIAAPRGHAKSTLISLAYVLWSICFERERFIVLLSDTAEQAQLLLEPAKRELMENDLILEDFPEAAQPPFAKPRPRRWRVDDIVTRNGVRVSALAPRKHLRGRRHGASRPSLIIADDLENEDAVRAPERRAALREWFSRTIANAGDRQTNLVVAGTILHYDAFLAELMDKARRPGWIRRKYQAVLAWPEAQARWEEWEALYRDEHPSQVGGPRAAALYLKRHQKEMRKGAQTLWPQRESIEDLMKRRVLDGVYSFNAEKQNEPVDPETCLFRPGDFRHWSDDWSDAEALLTKPGETFALTAACDPSMGRRGGDDSAVVLVARRMRDSALFVLEAEIRRRSPEQIVQDAVRICARYGRAGSIDFVVEENGFQKLLRQRLDDALRARGVSFMIRGVTNTADKEGRIQGLQPYVASGQLQFHRAHRRLLEQLERFPHARGDDGPDALEMAVRRALRGGGAAGLNI